MNKDRIVGSSKQAKGAVKKAVGRITGNTNLQFEGRADQVMGKIQHAVGGVKDTIRNTLRK